MTKNIYPMFMKWARLQWRYWGAVSVDEKCSKSRREMAYNNRMKYIKMYLDFRHHWQKEELEAQP